MPHIDRTTYDAYISSPHWAARRTTIIRRDAARCRACRGRDHLEVHHRTYERFTREHDDDLVTLCAGCHAAVHTFQRRTNLPLPEATTRYLARCAVLANYQRPPRPKTSQRAAKTERTRDRVGALRSQVERAARQNEPADMRDHTPPGWQPRHLRPEFKGLDWRSGRRSFADLLPDGGDQGGQAEGGGA